MKISCICPTYGRAPDYLHLLNEALESFLRQETKYEKELIILNDASGQKLVFDHPEVKVINVDERFASLGEKFNAAIEASSGELIMTWEDDDISLPWRIRKSVELLGDGKYYNPQRYWYLDQTGLSFDHPMGVSHNCSIFTREAWEAVGRYPEISGPQDAKMDLLLKTKFGNSNIKELPREDWIFIYRWGVSPNHLSSQAKTDDYYEQVGKQPLEQGTFQLRPFWKRDYVKMTKQLI